MAAGDLTTLDNVKAWLAITNTNSDALLASLITSVSTFVQSWLNRTIASAVYTDVRNGQGMRQMLFLNYPVSAVAYVLVGGITVPPRPALGGSVPSNSWGFTFDPNQLYLTGYEFCRGFQNVQMQYTAGFATTPPDIAQATILIIAQWFKTKRGDHIGVQSESIEAQSISFMKDAIDSGALLILQQYKRVSPIPQ